jgi:dTMP kinase
MCAFVTNHILPDKTFYLDLDPKFGQSRMRSRAKDRIEQEDLSFHNTVRDAFLKLQKKEPGRIFRLDASRTKEEVLNEAMQALDV